MCNNSGDSGLAGKRVHWSCFSLRAFVAYFIKAFHQVFLFVQFCSLHCINAFDISHTGYTDLPRVHLWRKALQQANELSLLDYNLIHSRTLRKIQSLKSVFLTSHDSLKTKGCLCRHGMDKDPSALVQSPGCGCVVFSHT